MSQPALPGIVYLVRHGQTTLNAEGRLRGHLDPPLDDNGIRQVKELGAAFAALPRRPHRVVAGPLLRTRQTGEAIAAACDIELAVDRRLIDRDYGRWTGEPADVVREIYGASLTDLPGAELLSEVVTRARAALAAQLPHLDEPVVLVAHDAVNRALLSNLDATLGPPHAVSQRTACWNRLERLDQGWQVAVVDGDAAALAASAG